MNHVPAGNKLVHMGMKKNWACPLSTKYSRLVLLRLHRLWQLPLLPPPSPHHRINMSPCSVITVLWHFSHLTERKEEEGVGEKTKGQGGGEVALGSVTGSTQLPGNPPSLPPNQDWKVKGERKKKKKRATLRNRAHYRLKSSFCPRSPATPVEHPSRLIYVHLHLHTPSSTSKAQCYGISVIPCPRARLAGCTNQVPRKSSRCQVKLSQPILSCLIHQHHAVTASTSFSRIKSDRTDRLGRD
jgi:hypothetical protein